jgi:hypothetical protein
MVKINENKLIELNQNIKKKGALAEVNNFGDSK